MMDDGSERECGPGDAVYIAPGHDAWIFGDEACVLGSRISRRASSAWKRLRCWIARGEAPGCGPLARHVPGVRRVLAGLIRKAIRAM